MQQETENGKTATEVAVASAPVAEAPAPKRASRSKKKTPRANPDYPIPKLIDAVTGKPIPLPRKKKTPPTASPTVDQRQGYIGGSDAAALLGLSPYSSPMQVFAEKTGRAIKLPPDPQREALFYFGHLLEAPIGQAVQHRYGLEVVRPTKGYDFFRSKKYPWMGGHLDFLLRSERGGFLECKNIRYPGAWGEMQADPLTMDGSHLVPDYYLCQCLHYMVVLECDRCYIAALIGGSDLRLYLITRAINQPLIDEIIRVEERFQKECVEPDEPPESINADDVMLRRQMFPVSMETPKQIPVTPQIEDWLKDLTAARTRAKKAENEATAARNSLILAANGPGRFVKVDGTEVGFISLGRKEVFDNAMMREKAPVAHSIYLLCFKESLHFLVKEKKDKESGEE